MSEDRVDRRDMEWTLMGATDIEWTGTRLATPLVLSQRVRLDGDVFLDAGTHTLLPGFTFNPWVGCQRVSEACRHCYAEAWSKRVGYTETGRHRLSIWGPPSTTPRVRTSAANWKRPHRWNRIARDLGVRFKVFCASLADVGEDHPQVAPWRAELFDLIDATPSLDWLLLTKRPDVLGAAWPWRAGNAPRHVWAGATAEDQPNADRRARELRKIPAVVRFFSMEPLLGKVDLSGCLVSEAAYDHARYHDSGMCYGDSHAELAAAEERPSPPTIAWVILGGESGGGHRTLDLGAVERIAAQCTSAGVPVFVKQDSGPNPGEQGRLSAALWALKQWPEVVR